MLIKPGEEFTADRVLEKALRQDIGPDPSLAMNKKAYKYGDMDSSIAPIFEYKKKYRIKDPILSSDAYYYDYKQTEKRLKDFEFEKEKPPTFIN